METLTTGDIARLLEVNQRTVIRWLNSGRLKGFKLPGRGNNRILVSDFIGFLEQNSIPLPPELRGDQVLVKPKVLLVDDEPAILRAMCRSLKPLGLELLSAGDGFHAGMLLVKHHPALIVLDLNMPGVDGFAVIRYIREELADFSIRILVVSALAGEQLNRALEMGANAVLAKPFANRELQQQVARLLESAPYD